jgi:hypothetical protein
MAKRDNGESKGAWAIHDSQSTEQLDSVFNLLQAARRRYLLYYLYNEDEPVLSLETVVEAVQEYEAAENGDDEPPSRQEVRTSLVHTHLPKLADVGVLDYDPRRGTVRFEGYPPLEEWLSWARRLELD